MRLFGLECGLDGSYTAGEYEAGHFAEPLTKACLAHRAGEALDPPMAEPLDGPADGTAGLLGDLGVRLLQTPWPPDSAEMLFHLREAGMRPMHRIEERPFMHLLSIAFDPGLRDCHGIAHALDDWHLATQVQVRGLTATLCPASAVAAELERRLGTPVPDNDDQPGWRNGTRWLHVEDRTSDGEPGLAIAVVDEWVDAEWRRLLRPTPEDPPG